MRCAASIPGLVVFCLASGWALAVPVVPQGNRDRERPSERQDDADRDRGDDRDQDRGDADRFDFDSRSISPRLKPPRPDAGDWYLGVAVDYSDSGAVITQVERGSPAARAGLESRDIIVTVNGYQVGRVLGRLFPLERELELRADRRGRVLLLIQNRRNGQLTPLTVQLEESGRDRDPVSRETLSGTIRVQPNAPLRRGSILVVRLLDVTDRRVPARVIALRTYQDLGPFPLPFDLDYDPNRVQSGRTYVLDAEITANGFTAWRTAERYPVFESGRQGRVDMVLRPVRG